MRSVANFGSERSASMGSLDWGIARLGDRAMGDRSMGMDHRRFYMEVTIIVADMCRSHNSGKHFAD
ncbi:MAG: hypothetical protein ACK52S_23960 [Pirellula sp.]